MMIIIIIIIIIITMKVCDQCSMRRGLKSEMDFVSLDFSFLI